MFDGHGGTDAASFIRKNILRYIIEDGHFPNCMEEAMKSAFLRADHAFADAHSLDSTSGTTALAALIFGRLALISQHPPTVSCLAFLACDCTFVSRSCAFSNLAASPNNLKALDALMVLPYNGWLAWLVRPNSLFQCLSL